MPRTAITLTAGGYRSARTYRAVVRDGRPGTCVHATLFRGARGTVEVAYRPFPYGYSHQVALDYLRTCAERDAYAQGPTQ